MSTWIVVGSPENFEIAKSRGFDMFGFKDKRKRESASMAVGDKLIFYLIGIMKFGGTAEVTGAAFEDDAPVFKTEKKPCEKYSNRIPTRPVRILDEDQYLDAFELGIEQFERDVALHLRIPGPIDDTEPSAADQPQFGVPVCKRVRRSHST